MAVMLLGGANFAWATDVPYNVGTSTSNAWGTAFSDVWTMTGDGAVTVTFINHCPTDGNWWDNWQLLCGNSDYTPAAHDNANRYFQMRSDRWDDAAGSAIGFIVSDDYFTDFKTFQNEATVTMKIVRSGTTVTVNTSVTKSATTRTMTFVKTGLTGTLNFFLTQSLSYMQITQQDQTTEMAGSVTCNALVNFNNFTGDGGTGVASVTGGKGSMTLNNLNFFTVKEGDDSYRLGIRAAGTSLALASSEYAGSKDIVTISFEMAFTRMANSNKSVYFYIQDASNANIATMTLTTNGNSSGYIASLENTLGIVAGDIVVDYSVNWDHKVKFTITLNYLTGKITTQTACSAATNTTNTHTVDMTNTNPVAKFVVGAGYNSDSEKYRCQFDNLLIQTEKGDYNTTANITLSFKDDEDNDISALYTGITDFTPEKGSTFDPADYYPAAMYDGDYKYTYTSGGDEFEVTTDQEVVLVYTKSARPTYTYNVTANYGAKSKKIVDAVSVNEAADYTYYYPRFILDGTTLYEYASSTDGNASAKYWTSTHTNVASNGTYTLTYNAIEGECVYFSEGEDVTGAVEYRYSGFRTAMSNGSTGVLDAANLTSLDAGVYSITARAVGRASDRYVDVYKNSVSDENKVFHLVAANAGSESTSQFSLITSTDIVASAGYNTSTNNGAGCDYIYIMKLPDNVSVTVSSAGFATYVPSYDLDFSATDIEAYKVKVSSKGVATLTQLDNVPAGTPVLLYKDGGATEDIPVMAGADEVSGNDLVTGTGAAVATTVGDYTNMILWTNATNPIGFYFANGQTVAANRAYLHIATSLAPDAAARMAMVFGDDEVTGVHNLNVNDNLNNEVYDLQGRRVMNAQKGLYIVNGKKVVIK